MRTVGQGHGTIYLFLCLILRFLRGLVCVAIVQNGRESGNATKLLTGKVARLGEER
jgi:hypothetical protein